MNAKSPNNAAQDLLGRYTRNFDSENIARLQEGFKRFDRTLRQQVEERPFVVVGAGFAFGLFMGTRVGLWAARTALRAGWNTMKGSLVATAGDAVKEALPSARA